MSELEENRDFWRLLIAWFLPPVGVYMQVGLTMQFWINLLLTFIFFVPGLVHAAWVIANTGPDGQPQADGMRRFWSLVLAPLFPPATVFMAKGVGTDLLLNIVLMFLGWVPGVLHATWVATHRR